eukprot:scaffold11354_cov63-Phaeocystis_antarctica.AAC.2
MPHSAVSAGAGAEASTAGTSKEKAVSPPPSFERKRSSPPSEWTRPPFLALVKLSEASSPSRAFSTASASCVDALLSSGVAALWLSGDLSGLMPGLYRWKMGLLGPEELPSGSPRPVSCTSKHTRGSGAPPTSPSAGAA